MTRSYRAPLIFFAIGMIGLGAVAIIYGDFAELWQPAAAWTAGRTGLAYLSGIVMLLGGIALLAERTAAIAVRVLLACFVVGFLLQLAVIVKAPLVEVNWESAGELGVLTSGCWILFATRSGLGAWPVFSFATGTNGIRIARILFGLSLLPIGLSHFAYLAVTVGLVPTWLPFRSGWAYLTGAAHIAAGLGVLFGVVPRLAAAMEAAMLAVFTLLVWLPRLIATPTVRDLWTEFFISWAIATCAWLIADSFAGARATER